MSDRRRPEERWSAFELELLRAGKGDAPQRGARRKTLLALSAGAGTALGSSATATGAAAVHTATTAAVGGASKIATLTLAKWVGLGVLAVAGTATAVRVTGEVHRENAVHAVQSPATVARVESRPLPAVPPASPARATESESSSEAALVAQAADTTSAEATIAAAPKKPPTPIVQPPAPESPPTQLRTDTAATVDESGLGPSSVPAAPAGAVAEGEVVAGAVESSPAAASTPKVTLSFALAEETSLLETVRVELRNGQASLALRRLERYAKAFPHGLLEPEAMVLRVEAFVANGDGLRARELGTQFLERFPQNPLAPRVRGLLLR